MQMISLSVPIRVWPAQTGQPVLVAALLGEVQDQEGTLRVDVHGLVPPQGGVGMLKSPVVVVLSQDSVAATQQVDPPARKES
jgi:hypothetical protein